MNGVSTMMIRTMQPSQLHHAFSLNRMAMGRTGVLAGTAATNFDRCLHGTAVRGSAVSLESIKELRKLTGAPINIVKKALVEQSGDIDAAIDYLRKHGAAAAAKKAHREASEGLIGIAILPDRSKASIVEVNSETDFVARTEEFGKLVRAVSESVLENASSQYASHAVDWATDELLSLGRNKIAVEEAVSALGENIVVRRAGHVCFEQGEASIHGYVHGALRPGNGTIGALVALSGSPSEALGQRIAMHVAAAVPRFMNRESVPDEAVEKERTILMEAASTESSAGSKPKPPAILQKIADGRLQKWFSSVVLEEQELLVESPSYNGAPRSVGDHIKAESSGAQLVSMLRMSIGEK